MKRLYYLSRQFSTLKKYRFNHANKMIPHPEKVKKGGEDACFSH